MTARSRTPEAMLRSAKRGDTTPKARRKVRGANSGRGVEVTRARGTNTSTNAAAASISPDKPLTDKQKLFVKFWAEGESITSASVRAGYNDGASIAYRMVRMPNVLRLYHEIKAKYEEAAQMSRQKVMDGLLEAVEMAKLMAEPATMVQGWKTIGQMCGYFAPVEHRMKVDVTGNIVVDRLNSMTDAELLKLITNGPAPEPPVLPC
jgi:phage terminase small subunit